MARFIGRRAELKRLATLKQKKSASFIVLNGRRRIGKSRLLEEFGLQFKHHYCFRGIPPGQETTKQGQLDEFSRQLSEQFSAPRATYQDWGDLFLALSERIQKGQTLLVFDEISWMGSKCATFLGKLKDAWDTHFKKNDQLIFVVCGSASSWIEKNIMSHTGFVGRISLTMTLDALPLADCRQFWPSNISSHEIFKVLSVTGGIPKYLEEINPRQTAENNINRLCFTRGGFLVEEFEQIFSDLFLRKSEYYSRILKQLLKGAMEAGDIQKALKLETIGRVNEYLKELELAGFITRDYTWKIKNGEDSKLSHYRLKDNYTRFYLKYIEKNLTKIKRGDYSFKGYASLSEWYSVAGLQFENLVLGNRAQIYQAIGIKLQDIVSENPYFQRPTSERPGCQIDYLIQTRFGTLYVCEIKFSKEKIGSSVIPSMEKKLASLMAPKAVSCRPVLIHVNGVTDELIEADYFSDIIDFSTVFD